MRDSDSDALVTGIGVILGYICWQYGLLRAAFTHVVGSVLLYLGVRVVLMP